MLHGKLRQGRVNLLYLFSASPLVQTPTSTFVILSIILFTVCSFVHEHSFNILLNSGNQYWIMTAHLFHIPKNSWWETMIKFALPIATCILIVAVYMYIHFDDKYTKPSTLNFDQHSTYPVCIHWHAQRWCETCNAYDIIFVWRISTKLYYNSCAHVHVWHTVPVHTWTMVNSWRWLLYMTN